MDQLNQAIQRQIPIIGFDSGVPNAPKGAIYATAATNSYAAAGLAADKMFAAIKDKIAAASDSSPVTIVDFNQDATSQSVTDRGKGFRDEMIKLITTQTSHPQGRHQGGGQPRLHRPRQPDHGKGDHHRRGGPGHRRRTRTRPTAAQAILNRVKSDNILGIFCSNEGTVTGGALPPPTTEARCPRSIPAWSSSGSTPARPRRPPSAASTSSASITQDPYQIGFQAVELAYKAVKGQPVADVDTGAKFYDSTNIDNPDIAQLVYD